jgi:hypothetical protein
MVNGGWWMVMSLDSRSEHLSRRLRRLKNDGNFSWVCWVSLLSTQPTDPCTEPISAKFLGRGKAGNEWEGSKMLVTSHYPDFQRIMI